MNRYWCIIVGLCCVVLAAFGLGARSYGATVLNLANPYIELRLGVDGTAGDADSGPPVACRYGVLTVVGDPETTGDDTRQLVYGSLVPNGYLGYWKVNVNGNVQVIGNSGAWSQLPYLQTSPPAGQDLGKAGPYIEGEWTTAPTVAEGLPIKFKIHAGLVRDMVRFELTATNPNPTAVSLGIGMFEDVIVENTDLSGYPFVPGIGLTKTAGISNNVYGKVLGGNNVPPYLECFDDVESPTIVARNTLRVGDCTQPDWLAIGEWSNLSSTTLWLPGGYAPDPQKAIEDLSLLLVWNPKVLVGGASRKVVTYYGVGAASSAWTYKSGSKIEQDSVAVAVQGPRSLKYDTSNGDSDPSSALSPSEFDIKAYVYNLAKDSGPYGLKNVKAFLYLPTGLALKSDSDIEPPGSDVLQMAGDVPGSGSNTLQQMVGDVAIDSESQPVTWTVKATGEASGELEYFVSFMGEMGDDDTDVKDWQQDVSRKIMVPAIKTSFLRSGYQLMSVPFTFNDLAVEHAILGLTLGSFSALYYDPITAKGYVSMRQLKPGRGFWMRKFSVTSGSEEALNLASDAAIVGELFGMQMGEKYIDLGAGWNMIGNPYVYPIYVGQVLVYNEATKSTVTLERAVANNWISGTLFAWNLDKRAYDIIRSNDAMLEPWKGYWVRAKIPVTLVFRPAVWPNSAVISAPGGF